MTKLILGAALASVMREWPNAATLAILVVVFVAGLYVGLTWSERRSS